MKLHPAKLLLLIGLILCSVLFGLGYDAAATALEKRSYPLDERYESMVLRQAETFGVPPTVIWATVRHESRFQSNLLSKDGSIGLMQIHPELLATVCTEVLGEPVPESGMLYDPETNLRIGTAWLSALYEKYGMWESVYAAWVAGTGSADFWLTDPECLNEQGRLTYIPDRDAAQAVADLKKASEAYASLYYES